MNNKWKKKWWFNINTEKRH